MERDAAETQELCVKALRSVREASDVDLLVTIGELEGLVPDGGSYKKLLNADAANELLSIAKQAINNQRPPVAQAALRLLSDGLQEEELTDILLIDANLTASSVDAQLEEVAACLMGSIPSGIVEIYGMADNRKT
ncbi:hypothetical protein ACSSS7_008340 [Eimeria intestinalis]